MSTSAEPDDRGARRPYERPVVVEHGTLADLTLGAMGPMTDDAIAMGSL